MRGSDGRAVLGLVVAAAIATALSTQAGAQEKIWKHGLINAKSDAGFSCCRRAILQKSRVLK